MGIGVGERGEEWKMRNFGTGRVRAGRYCRSPNSLLKFPRLPAPTLKNPRIPAPLEMIIISGSVGAGSWFPYMARVHTYSNNKTVFPLPMHIANASKYYRKSSLFITTSNQISLLMGDLKYSPEKILT